MADESTQVAEPSSAASETQNFEVPRDGAEYANWRVTGELPAQKPKSDSSAESRENSAAADENGAGKSAPAPEAGKGTQGKKQTAEERLNQILSDLKTAGLTPSELKTFKREAGKVETPAAETQQKPAHTAKPAELKAPTKPDINDPKFKTWDEYQTALEEWRGENQRYEIQKAIAEDRAQRAADSQRQELGRKIDEAKVRYGDDAQSTIVETSKQIWGDQKISPVIKHMLGESPVLVDVMYVMGSKPEELAQFISDSQSNPGGAIRRLALLENLVMQELAKGGGKAAAGKADEKPAADVTAGRDESTGRFTPAGNRQTAAPKPPTEANARSAPPPDASEAAFQNGDFRAFMRTENERDLARVRGR